VSDLGKLQIEMSSVQTWIECEVKPLQTRGEIIVERLATIIQRGRYLELWVNGETTAPALEVLLYFVVPISHLEGLLGDLEEEYRTVQIPNFGPKAAQWWYAKHVLRTAGCYLMRACKTASVVAGAVDSTRRILHWLRM